MASRSLGALTLDLIAKVGGFVGGLTKAERASDKWRKEVTKDAERVGAALGAFVGTAGTAFAAMTVHTIKSAREIQNLARVANTPVKEFQELSLSAERFGVSQEKVADLLKDTSDKIGVFLQTEGGQLKDFFDNIAPQVGVTADQFRDLSGADALGLYVSSLEKANLSQSEMISFMEAIASDATLLLPLLRNNGTELKRLSGIVQDFGAALSDVDLTRLVEIDEKLEDLELAFSGIKKEISFSTLPAIEDLVELLTDPETIENAKLLAEGIIGAFSTAAKAIVTVTGAAKKLGQEIAALSGGIAGDDIKRLESRARFLRTSLDKQSFLQSKNEVVLNLTAKYKEELSKIERQIKDYYKDPANVPTIPVDIGGDTGSGKKGTPTTDNAAFRKKLKERADALKEIARINDQAENIRQSLLPEEDAIRESYKRRREIILKNTEITGNAQSELLKRLDAERDEQLSNTTEKTRLRDELERINEQTKLISESLLSEEEQIKLSYKRRREIILKNTEITGNVQAELLRKLNEAQLKELEEIAEKQSVFWDEAARNIQDSFAEFLFDPFDKGLDGMLEDFEIMLRRMAANAAAAQISESIFGKKGENLSGFASSAGSFVSGLFGFQHGGSFTVGGSGGADSQVVAFKATPGEEVTITPRGQGGDINVTVVVRGEHVEGLSRSAGQAGVKIGQSIQRHLGRNG